MKFLSLNVIVLTACIYLFAFYQFERWHVAILGGGDTWGYYVYLPAIFIHQDLANLENSVSVRNSYGVSYVNTATKNPLGIHEAQYIGDGKQVIKYTMGVAILNVPFFCIAHLLAIMTNYPADGYSLPYIVLIHLSSIFYVLLGLYFLRKVLLNFFSDKITAISLLVVALSTNLYYFSVYNSPMSHAYLFSLYCLLLYGTVQWYALYRLRYALLVGLTAGMITLIRPVELICIVIPLLYGLTSWGAVKQRLLDFKTHYLAYSLAALVFVLAGLPQFLYWKWISGGFLFYSYGNESFNFTDPHIYSGLFSFKNGWLAYTPVMIFALLGCLFLLKHRKFLLPIYVFLPLHVYIAYSWWCWYYINGFGSRPMVETYALLAIPLAYTVQYAYRHRLTKIVLIGSLLFFTWLNMFSTYQFSLGVLWSENGNWEYYKSIIGKTELSYNDLVRFDSGEPQPTKATYVRTLHENNFVDSLGVNYTRQYRTDSLSYVYHLTPKNNYFPSYKTTIAAANLKAGDWLRVSAKCFRKHKGVNLYRTNIMVTTFERKKQSLKWRMLRLDNKIANPKSSLWGGKANVWHEVAYFVQVPLNIQEKDLFKTYIWNNKVPDIYLDDFKVEVWR